MEPVLPFKSAPEPKQCTCLAVRQAARHLTQFYDQFLASVGLRTTQYQLLARLKTVGPISINGLAAELAMDRTTLGRNILPLEREGLIKIAPGRDDRRSREISLTTSGKERVRQGTKKWSLAQAQFADAFGKARNAQLRELLQAASSTELPSGKALLGS
jgi:DNA-binding MarR family transcriptional regulator